MMLFSKGLKDTEIVGYKNTVKISIYFFQISVNEIGKMLKLELKKFLGNCLHNSFPFLKKKNRNQTQSNREKNSHFSHLKGKGFLPGIQ